MEESNDLLQSELLQQSFQRAHLLFEEYDRSSQDRMRDLNNELSNFSSKRSKDAIERRKSSVMFKQLPKIDDVHDADSLVNTLMSIALAEEMDSKELQLSGLDEDDMDRDQKLMDVLLQGAQHKVQQRTDKLQHSFQQFQSHQQKLIDQEVHNYRQSTGYYKYRSRFVELESQLSKNNALLTEKRYLLKLQAADSTSTEDLRLKFEAETEELIRQLLATINQQQQQQAHLAKQLTSLTTDSDTIYKEIGQVLHDLDKENKLSTTKKGPMDEDLFAVFPCLADSTELTEEMLMEAQRTVDASNTDVLAKQIDLITMKERLADQQAQLAQLLRSEENRALERLKTKVAALEEKCAQDRERLAMTNVLVGNLDSLTNSLQNELQPHNHAKVNANANIGSSASMSSAHANAYRKSIGGRISMLANAPTASSPLSVPTEVGGDSQQAAHYASETNIPVNDTGKYLALQHKYAQTALKLQARAAESGAGPGKGAKAEKGVGSKPVVHDSSSDSEQEKAKPETRKAKEQKNDTLLPITTSRSIRSEQVAGIQGICDLFQALHQLYRGSSGVQGALIPFSESAIQPFHSSSHAHHHPPLRKHQHSSHSPKPPAETGKVQEKGPQSSRHKGVTFQLSSNPLHPSASLAQPSSIEAQEKEGIEPTEATAPSPLSLAMPSTSSLSPSSSPKPIGGVGDADSNNIHEPQEQRLSQLERTLALEQQERTEAFRSYGVQAGVRQLLGLLEVLTHSNKSVNSSEQLPQSSSSVVHAAETVATQGAEGVSVALLAASPNQSAMTMAMRSEEEELERIEHMEVQIAKLLHQAKEGYRQSHQLDHTQRALLKERNAASQRYDRLKCTLYGLVDANAAFKQASGEDQEQLAEMKLEVQQLKQQLRLWLAKLQSRRQSNLKLASYLHSDNKGDSHRSRESKSLVQNIEREREDRRSQLVFDDISALYEKSIQELQRSLQSV